MCSPLCGVQNPQLWQKPQNVLEPYLKLLVVYSYIILYECVYSSCVCVTFISGTSPDHQSVWLQPATAYFFTKESWRKKRFILCFVIVIIHILPAVGFKGDISCKNTLIMYLCTFMWVNLEWLTTENCKIKLFGLPWSETWDSKSHLNDAPLTFTKLHHIIPLSQSE